MARFGDGIMVGLISTYIGVEFGGNELIISWPESTFKSGKCVSKSTNGGFRITNTTKVFKIHIIFPLR